MQLTNRQREIIIYLNNFEHEISGKNIAEHLQVSIRTIQNEIKDINKTYHKKIIDSNNKGYWLNKNKIQNFNEILNSRDITKDTNDLKELVKKLILEDKVFQFDELADELHISSSTLQRRLKKIKTDLERYHLHLSKKNNYITIKGTEYNKRQMIRDLIIGEVDPVFANIEDASNYFQNLNIFHIKDIIMSSIHKYNYNVNPCYSTNIIINILIAIYRIKNNNFVEPLENKYCITNDMVEYRISKEICARLARHLCLSITENDIQYIAMLIMGQIKPDSFVNVNEYYETDIASDIKEIIQSTFNYYMLNIDCNTLMDNFILHIDSLIKRAKNQQFVSGLLSENIKESYPFIYDVALHLTKKLEERFHISIVNEEVNLISIYIGFIIEKSISNDDKIRVLIVCNEYYHIKNNILSKLKDKYENKIDIVNIVNNFIEKKHIIHVDLIISTFPINIVGRKIVTITPFYTDIDSVKIDNAIYDALSQKKKKKYQELLLTYFSENLFFKNLGISSKEEAIRFLGQKLENSGLVSAGFTDSVLKREAMSSTCFFETFAVPHAIEMNAIKTTCCVLLEEHGIQWDEHNIKCVFMIAVNQNDRKEFMKIYSGIIQVLCDKEFINQLIKAHDFPSFIKCFTQE